MINFSYITNSQQLYDAIQLLYSSDSLACDSETYALSKYGVKGSALDPHTGRISLLILKTRESIPLVFDIILLNHNHVDLEPLHEQIRRKDYILGQNLKFDLKMFQSTFGYMPERVRDTMIMAKLIGNATGSKANLIAGYGYADLCRDLLNVHITGKKDLRESTWGIGVESRTLDNEWWLQKVTYAANDVQYLYPLEDILLPTLLNPLPSSPLTHPNEVEVWGLDMREVFEREMAYVPLLARREYEGMPVSIEMFNSLQRGAEEALNEVACDLSIAFQLDLPKEDWEGNMMPSPVALKVLRSSEGLKKCIKKALKFEALDNVQANVLTRIVEILEKLELISENGEEVSSVFIDEDEEVLYKELEDLERSDLVAACGIMKKVLDFKRLSKQVSMDLRKYINMETGKIHATINQIGTATGRVSCLAPGSLIMIPGGAKDITLIQPNDYVYSYDKDQLTIKRVVNVFENEAKALIRLRYNTKSYYLDLTPEHKLLTTEGWVEAQELTPDHKILSAKRIFSAKDNKHYADVIGANNQVKERLTIDGQLQAITIEILNDNRYIGYESITDIIKLESTTKVYNLEVEDTHNFIANGLCCKNCNSPNLQQVSARTTIEIEIEEDNLFKI
jgi:hypothetical protein